MTLKLLEKTVSKRINLTLPDKTVEVIEQWAQQEGRTVAGMSAYLLQKTVDDAREKGLIKEIDHTDKPTKGK